MAGAATLLSRNAGGVPHASTGTRYVNSHDQPLSYANEYNPNSEGPDIAQTDKLVYTAKTHATGGREGGSSLASTNSVMKAGPHMHLTKKSAAYWKVILDNPPLNIIGPREMRELVSILNKMEADPKVQVVVFESAVPGYFSAHYDLLSPLEASTGMEPGPTGMHPVPDFMVRLSRLPVVSIVSIRGRASGIGSELALAADKRFASREKAVLSQFEVGAGFVPGGGPMARLPRLVGRGRALEILVGGDDIGGELAERYGYVNRALPDAELDPFVDALAARIASFDRRVIVEIKRLVNIASLPPDSEMQPEWDAFIGSVSSSAAQARLKVLIDKGLQTPGEVEEHLGRHTAEYMK
jgi:enoyl-CoA hydratase/carnithine racemase